MIERVTGAHDEVVLVGVTQQRVVDAVEEVGSAFGQIHIIEVNKVELAKVCGKIELLSDMLSELEKTPAEGENEEAEKDADKNDNG